MEVNPAKRFIDGAAVIKDIRSGMSDSALMKKYNLSSTGLERLFNQLIAFGAIRQIQAKELLKDVRSGMTNKDLMEKYKLSRYGLKKVFEEITQAGITFFGERSGPHEKKRVDARAITEDILAGMTELQIMEKYSLSSRGLQSTFCKLVQYGILTWDEILGIYPDLEESVTLRNLRHQTRGYPILAVEVFEENNPQNSGKIIDLSNRGLGVKGLLAGLGEVKTLMLVPPGILDIHPIRLQAACRWCRPNQSTGLSSAGFEITDRDQKALDSLDALLEVMTFTFE